MAQTPRHILVAIALPYLKEGQTYKAVADALGIHYHRLQTALKASRLNPESFNRQTAPPLAPKSLDLLDLVEVYKQKDPKIQGQKEAIESLYDLWNVQKLSLSRIIRITGLSRYLIEQTIAKNNWPLHRPSKFGHISTEELKNLYVNKTIEQIADHFCSSPNTVRSLFKRHKIPVGGGRRSSLLKGDEEEIEKLWKEGKKIDEIADWLGVPRHVISPWIGILNNRKKTQAYHEKEAENGDLGAPAKDPRTV